MTFTEQSGSASIRNMRLIIIIIIVIITDWATVVSCGRRKHAASKLPYLAQSSARSGHSSICTGRLSTAWQVSIVELPCHMVWSPHCETVGPSVVFGVVDVSCPRPLHCPYIADYIYDFCPPPCRDIGLSVLVCDAEHTSFHFGLCGRKI